jgi:lipoyl(octanoyl) transferase
MTTPTLSIEHWGSISYREAWSKQQELQTAVQQGKRDSTLVLCQHPTVITIGKNGGRHNVIVPQDVLTQRGIEIVEINRGGDVTLHNPGQLVGYPIMRLTDYKPDLHWFLREIEQCIIETLATLGIASERYDGYTGVWIDSTTAQARKICAIGIHCSRWVTAHGFALNINNALEEFHYIVPCGISDKAVTSVAAELQRTATSAHSITPYTTLWSSSSAEEQVQQVQTLCAEQFLKHFG